METSVINSINWVDILILAMLGRGIYLGFSRGSAWGLIRFVGILLVSLIAFSKSYPLAKWIQERFALDSPYIEWVFFILLGVILGSVVNFGIFALTRMLGLAPEGVAGRIAGMVLGALQASILISLVMVTLTMSRNSYLDSSVRRKSLLGARFMTIAPTFYTGMSGAVPGGGKPSLDVWRKVSEG